jgi:hypothetical protein
MTESLSNNTRHGGTMSAIALTLAVPAFAGTTLRFALGVT